MQGADNGGMVDFEGTALQLLGPVSGNAASANRATINITIRSAEFSSMMGGEGDLTAQLTPITGSLPMACWRFWSARVRPPS
jgi:hypothetical protein